MSLEISYSDLTEMFSAAELTLLAVDSGQSLGADLAYLQSWQTQGFAADMGYMLRPAQNLANASSLFPELKSLITFALPYSSAPKPKLIPNHGRVARYAWGRDYHLVSKERLLPMVEKLVQRFGASLKYKIFSDAVPLLERAYASQAGLGFVGKNTMLIKPKLGSFFFIAEILTNLKVLDLPQEKITSSCKACTNCLDYCPTKAFVAPNQLDARRCISYLTIEKRGLFNQWEAAALGEWLFGCDLCQEICPFNHQSLVRINPAILPEFQPEQGVGGLLSLSEIFNLKSNRIYLKRFEGTALLRTGRKGLLRNAACVAANIHADELLESLLLLAEEDSSLVVRWHCFTASLKLQAGKYTERLNRILNKLRSEVEASFLAELQDLK